MNDFERMLNSELYIVRGEKFREAFARSRRLTHVINTTQDRDERVAAIRELMGRIGEHFYIAPPFYCDYGSNIYIGENFGMNYNCVFLDSCPITIGNNVMMGPGVNLITASHPLDAEVRIAGYEIGKPVTIGDNVWLGANVVVNPGVTIGENTIIGSGSVVTKDIPANVVAVGNPCRVLREIGEDEKEYWRGLRDEYKALEANE